VFDIDHISQKDNISCGAVCIEMIFKHHKIKVPCEHILYDISSFNGKLLDGCFNLLILRYLVKLGFQTSVTSVTDLENPLKICDLNKIYVIFNLKSNEYSEKGHYVLYLGIIKDKIYYNDPAHISGRSFRCVCNFKKLLEPNNMVKQKNTLILINLRKEKLPESKLVCEKGIESQTFSCISEYVTKILNLKHGEWLRVNNNRPVLKPI
jgi:ABC-type bacteriocin/lantibiotic exporter with double-glycine peptidase domain